MKGTILSVEPKTKFVEMTLRKKDQNQLTWETVKPGMKVSGRVKAIKDFGMLFFFHEGCEFFC